jgi:hypothetical protein
MGDKKMRVLLLTLFITLVLFSPVQAEEVVFNASPLTRVTSSAYLTKRDLLSESERKEHPVLITKKGNRYFWANRNNRPLIYEVSGYFHLFIDPRSASYIKICDSERLPGYIKEPKPRYKYMEYMTIRMDSITYWGAAEKFEP